LCDKLHTAFEWYLPFLRSEVNPVSVCIMWLWLGQFPTSS
jgi:hypothetical protein